MAIDRIEGGRERSMRIVATAEIVTDMTAQEWEEYLRHLLRNDEVVTIKVEVLH